MSWHMETWNSLFVLSVCLWVQLAWRTQPALAHGAVLLSRFGTGRPRYWLNRGRESAEEARDKCEAEASPGAEHGPAVAVANIIGQAVQVPRVTGKLEVDASDAGTEGDDTEGSCKNNKMLKDVISVVSTGSRNWTGHIMQNLKYSCSCFNTFNADYLWIDPKHTVTFSLRCVHWKCFT